MKQLGCQVEAHIRVITICRSFFTVVLVVLIRSISFQHGLKIFESLGCCISSCSHPSASADVLQKLSFSYPQLLVFLLNLM